MFEERKQSDSLQDWYVTRFGIETSHREANEVRPMTKATNPSLWHSLVFIAFAIHDAMSLTPFSPSLALVHRQRLWKRLLCRVFRQDQEYSDVSATTISKPVVPAKKFVPLPRKGCPTKKRSVSRKHLPRGDRSEWASSPRNTNVRGFIFL